MKLPISLLLATSLFSCTDSPKKETKKQEQTPVSTEKDEAGLPPDPVKTKGKTVLVTEENEPSTLVFDIIPESEFNQLKARKFLRKVKANYQGDQFQLTTAVRKHTFRKYKDYGEPENHAGVELLGYYPGLKLYALTENSTAEHMGFGELFLLDSITDYRYRILSIGDGSVEIPIPSPNNQYFVYYYNWTYDHHNSELAVLKINSKKTPGTYLVPHASHSSEEFAVEQIAWKSDHCFYVKGYRETYDGEKWVKEFSYYRVTFK